ncbi:hypothetical protein [Synechococcus sp. M16CYN]|uniref:hypothetical protein n=1 Tax=Synechococcus sp. M16CYN TaxID=3103139 RepID=UPI0033418E94
MSSLFLQANERWGDSLASVALRDTQQQRQKLVELAGGEYAAACLLKQKTA